MSIRDEVLEFRRSYMERQEAGDVEGCVAHWDADGMLLPPGAPAVRGRAALLEWYEASFAQVRHDFVVNYDEVHAAGEWSFATGTARGRLIPQLGATPPEGSYKFVEIHRRQPDGSIKCYAHMWSSNSADD